MIDDEDVEMFALFSSPTTSIGFAITIVILIALWMEVDHNKNQCAEMKCDNGAHPALVSHECLCVTKAVP